MGREFRYTDAKRKLSQVLDAAEQDGEARIIRRDGKIFKVLPIDAGVIRSITQAGIIIECDGVQLPVSFDQYPELAEATVEQIFRGRLIGGQHLRFEELDIDIDLQSLTRLEQFPLKYDE